MMAQNRGLDTTKTIEDYYKRSSQGQSIGYIPVNTPDWDELDADTETAYALANAIGEYSGSKALLKKLLQKDLITPDSLVDISLIYLLGKYGIDTTVVDNLEFIDSEIDKKYKIKSQVSEHIDYLQGEEKKHEQGLQPPFDPQFDVLPGNRVTELNLSPKAVELITGSILGKQVGFGETTYNQAENVLKIQGKQVTPSKKNTKQHDLLKALMKKPNRIWSIDEMLEEIEGVDSEETPKKYYRKLYLLANAINSKVAVETGLKSLILVDSKQVQINREYL